PPSLGSNSTELTSTLQTVQQALEKVPGVQQVTPITNTPANTVAVFLVVPTTGPDDAATTDLVERLRGSAIAQAVTGTDIDAQQVYVGGETAELIDLTQRINDRLFLIIGTVLAGSFLLLMMVF